MLKLASFLIHGFTYRIGCLAFWSMRWYVKRRLKARWWDEKDTWQVLTDLAEELSGCKCLETQWSDSHVTRRR